MDAFTFALLTSRSDSGATVLLVRSAAAEDTACFETSFTFFLFKMLSSFALWLCPHFFNQTLPYDDQMHVQWTFFLGFLSFAINRGQRDGRCTSEIQACGVAVVVE